MLLNEETRKKILKYMRSGNCPIFMLPIYRWWLQRRPEQICPSPVPTIWFLLGGRGSGKTYTAANHIYEYCVGLPHTPENRVVYVALIGSVFDDVKHTMVEGKSGLLNIIPGENLLAWNRTVGELKFFIQDGGEYREVHCLTYTAERPEKLRGPNTHVAWMDEMAKFKDADTDPITIGTTWSNMMGGLRLGTKPHVIVTGTPTPCKLVRYILEHPDMKLTKMKQEDNAKNLPDSFLAEYRRYRPDSRFYRQEALAEVLLDNPNALFMEEDIELNRSELPDINEPDSVTLERPKILKVLAYDPSASSSVDSDECGIVICGYTPEVKQVTKEKGGRPVVVKPTHAYVLEDLSGHYTPNEQVQKVIQKVLKDRIEDLVFEQNQGVEFVMGSLEQAIKDNTVEYRVRKHQKSKKTDYGVVKRWFVSGVDLDNNPFKFTIYAIHAVKGKQLRAEMVSTRYESNQVHHPNTALPRCEISSCGASLETQMTSWDPKKTNMSPDRLDALVYCLLHIFSGFMLTRSKVTISRPPADVNQMSSQHGAVKKGRSVAGIYSTDVASGNPADMADRGLIPHLDDQIYDSPYFR